MYRSTQGWALSVIAESAGDQPATVPERLQRIALRFLEAAQREPAASRMLLQFREEHHLDEGSRGLARKVQEALQQVIAVGKQAAQAVQAAWDAIKA